ncbi:MAG: phage holin family protein [Streptosporangiales bacterium]|nr:phage holin family protein [Streptosporangiales bacterium]
MSEDVRRRVEDDRRDDPSVGDAAGALARDVAVLVRQEFDRAVEQLRRSARESGLGLGMVGGAALCAAMTATGASLSVLRLLETRLPRPAAAAVFTALYGGGTVALAAAGIRNLRAARRSVLRAAAEPGPAD